MGVPTLTGAARHEHLGPRTRPLFDTGKAATASCLPNQTAHAPEQGGTGGQQSSVRRRLLRKSTVNGSMVRGPRPQSMVRWRVFDHCVAPVAWCLGSHLAGYRLPGIRLPAIALLIKTPRALHTSGPCLVVPAVKDSRVLTVRAAPLETPRQSPSVKQGCGGMSRPEPANCDLCISLIAVLWRG